MKRPETWLALILIGVVVGLPAPRPVPAQPASEDVQKEAEEAQLARDIFLRQQLVLFKQGELVLEFDAFYSTDTRQENLLIGSDIAVDRLTTRSVRMTIIARYSLIDNLELDLILPFAYAKQETEITDIVLVDDLGVGDIAGRVRYQLLYERRGRPALTLDVDVKSPSGEEPLLGTGHWNVGVGITLVKTIDPVVFFGSLEYVFTLEREGSDPGDRILYQLGMGYSLNDRVSFKMQLTGAYVGKTEREGEEIPGSSLEILSLQFSVTVLVTKRLFIEPAVSLGLTEEATDVVAGISVPFRF